MRRFVDVGDGGNSARLCVETFGDARDDAVLLIGGMGWSMDFWDEDFCLALAERARYVIRYDARDTGESTTYPVGSPGYTGTDMVADAAAILDVLGHTGAHVVGLSMGGAIAQRLALEYRDRVLSLTLLATSSIEPVGEDLPGPTRELSLPEPDWDDPAAVVEWMVETERLYAGADFSEAASRARIERVLARSSNFRASQTNQALAPEGEMAPPRLAELAGLDVLVVHGANDPLFPIEHARALARMIPGARLLELDGVGHELPPQKWWPTLIDELSVQA